MSDVMTNVESMLPQTPRRSGFLRLRSGLYINGMKRVFDLVASIVMLPFILPLIMVFWLMARLDGGSGFFGQPRVGLYGRTFTCWKLRTMKPDAEAILEKLISEDPALAAEWEVNQKLADDPRITRFGRFLRATSLDELPQIFNVLMGDMSFVGPRPMMTNQETIYRDAGGRAYFELPPGITGPWQIEGRGTTSFKDRVTFDEGYFQTMSVRKDLGYMLKTVGVVLQRTGR